MIKDFNKIVNIMLRKWWNVMFKRDIFEIIDPECKLEYSSVVNKIIYRLKAEGYIISIKAWVYIVPDAEDRDLNSVDLIEKYYIKLLKKYIVAEVWSSYYISWLKSLQFHMKDFSIPEKIQIITRSTSKKITLWNYEIIFKTLSWKYQWKKLNLYTKFLEYSKTIEIENTDFKISGLELSLLESALVSDIYEWLDISILVKAIKKYGNIFDTAIFREVWKYKYNMSCNRLKEITKPMNKDLYNVFLDIIKQNGGCFVWEGLRGI